MELSLRGSKNGLRTSLMGSMTLKRSERKCRLSRNGLAKDMSEKDLAGEIKRLEKQMNSEAKNLEFEKAASTRDRLTKVKEMAFGARSRDSIG
jgi:excinuclease ABC subunit B